MTLHDICRCIPQPLLHVCSSSSFCTHPTIRWPFKSVQPNNRSTIAVSFPWFSKILPSTIRQQMDPMKAKRFQNEQLFDEDVRNQEGKSLSILLFLRYSHSHWSGEHGPGKICWVSKMVIFLFHNCWKSIMNSYELLSKPLLTLNAIRHLRFPIAFSTFGVLMIWGYRWIVLYTWALTVFLMWILLHPQCMRSCYCHCC